MYNLNMFQLLKFKTCDQKLDEEHLYEKKVISINWACIFTYSFEQFSATFQDILRNGISELKTK